MAASTVNPAVKFIKYWLPVIIYAILIFCLSSIPGKQIPSLFIYQDVVFHILEYAIFALLIIRALKAYNPGMVYSMRFLLTICLVILYAAGDEFHQSFISGRCPSLIDITYDGIGAFIMSIIYR